MSIIYARKPTRLKEYDYSENGYYYVTICAENREQIFGTIKNNRTIKDENTVSPLQRKISNQYNGLGQYISWFKRMTTNKYIYHVKTDGWKSFNKRLWQRNYYDHIIRNEKSLQKIREYIINNPATWADDENNQNNTYEK